MKYSVVFFIILEAVLLYMCLVSHNMAIYAGHCAGLALGGPIVYILDWIFSKTGGL